ncbi:arrestin homolog isoform X3 [Nasonia vitripennis]|uniref:Arrestin C-terminal-like domain-containing protein n=1 Tax=Nasonia vitripennis TaxID=7425 RepID=A0A7M7G3Y1_NASVI|nr:arrestin homolog isoform X3 [Nasonia vitripennis]
MADNNGSDGASKDAEVTATAPPTPPDNCGGSAKQRQLISRSSNNESLVRKVLQQQSAAESGRPADRRESHRPSVSETGLIYSQRAFKKSSQNGKLTLYLASRDLVVTAGKIDKLQGVLLIDPEILQNKKVYGQVTLTFRYGREDEEVMGLKFCNEAIMSLAQLYPPYYPADRQEPTTPFQEVLVKRFHPNAHPFTMAVTPLAPPSVQLVPAKEYNGAPIGTSYDVRVYAAERPDEKLTRKMQIIKMGIRVIQGANTPPPSRGILPTSVSTESAPGTPSAPRGKPQRAKSASAAEDVNEIKPDEADPPIPHAVVEKQFLLSDGRVRLEASLDRAIYGHGDAITVRVHVTNNSGKSVKRIEADIVQHVDVCMFSNGKFKNIVAQMSSREGCPVEPGFSLTRSYILRPEKGSTKNWIALEDDPGYAKSGANLASTVLCSGSSPEDRNVFAIYVSYYVKVKIVVSPIGEWIGGVVSLKLPFTLMHSNTDPELYGTPSSPLRAGSRILDKIETVDDPSEDPLPFIDKDSTSDEEGGDGGEQPGLSILNRPVPTTTLATIAKLTTAPGIETTSLQTTNKEADLIEHCSEEAGGRGSLEEEAAAAAAT